MTHPAKHPKSKSEFYDQIENTPIISNLDTPLSPKVRSYIEECVKLCQPDDVYVCDGSEAENTQLIKLLEKKGTIEPLTKYINWLVIFPLHMVSY